MLLPLRDENPLRIIPFQIITIGIIATCIAVFLYQASLPPRAAEAFVYAYGIIPAVLFDVRSLPPGLERIPAEATLVTSLFLHGGVAHLVGNMLYLWIFGDNIEDSMGHLRFVVFYLLCGVAASLAHAFVEPASTMPLVGASGAISGIMGAYVVLHPRVKVLVMVMFPFTVRLPAFVMLGGWIGVQVLNYMIAGPEQIAWLAHIGGFAAGIILIWFFRRRSIPLFDGGTRH